MPYHHDDEWPSVAEFPLTTFMGRTIYVDFRDTVTPYTHITAADLDRATAGKLREGDIVIIGSAYKLPPFTDAATTDKDHRRLIGKESAEWFRGHKAKCAGFGDVVSIYSKDDYKAYPATARRVIEYLKSNGFEKMKPGVFGLEGKDIYAQVFDAETGPVNTGAYEAAEHILKRAYFFKSVENEGFLHAVPGCFAVFFPYDILRPAVAVSESMVIRKVVVKVKTTLI